jgi:hypothetical protein
MAYSDFSINNVSSKLDLVLQPRGQLFAGAKSHPADEARSEFMIAPILLALRNLSNQQINIFSGQEFTFNQKFGPQRSLCFSNFHKVLFN